MTTKLEPIPFESYMDIQEALGPFDDPSLFIDFNTTLPTLPSALIKNNGPTPTHPENQSRTLRIFYINAETRHELASSLRSIGTEARRLNRKRENPPEGFKQKLHGDIVSIHNYLYTNELNEVQIREIVPNGAETRPAITIQRYYTTADIRIAIDTDITAPFSFSIQKSDITAYFNTGGIVSIYHQTASVEAIKVLISSFETHMKESDAMKLGSAKTTASEATVPEQSP